MNDQMPFPRVIKSSTLARDGAFFVENFVPPGRFGSQLKGIVAVGPLEGIVETHPEVIRMSG